MKQIKYFCNICGDEIIYFGDGEVRLISLTKNGFFEMKDYHLCKNCWKAFKKFAKERNKK